MPLSLDGTGSIVGIVTVSVSDDLAHVGDTNTKISFPANDTITALTGGSERLRITSTGTLQVQGDGNAYLQLERYQNNTGSSRVRFVKSRSDTVGTNAIVQDGDQLGAVDFYGSDGNSGTRGAASISAEVDGTPGSADMPGRLVFKTVPDGSTTFTERLRINSAGEVYIGSATGNGQGKLFVNDSSGATTTQAHIRNATSTGTAKVFLNLDDAKYASVGLENGSLVFRNSTSSTPTEILRIDSGGVVIKGHTTPSGDLHDSQTLIGRSPRFQLHGINSVQSGAALISWKSGTGSYYSPNIYLARSGSDTIGTNALIANNAPLGAITFNGDDGGEFAKAAVILGEVDGTSGADNMPGRLIFKTTPSGTQSPVERLRIAANGQVGINQTPDASGGLVQIRYNEVYTSGTTNLLTSASKAALRIRTSSDSSKSLFFGGIDESATPYLQVGNMSSASGGATATYPLVLQPYGGTVNIGGNYTQTNAPLSVTTDANDYGIRLLTGSNIVFDLLNNDGSGNCEIRGYHNNNTGTRGEGFRIESNGNTFFSPAGSNRTFSISNAEFQVNNQEVQITSSNSYATHLNYQDNGTHYISIANSGSVIFRNATAGGTLMRVMGSGGIGGGNSTTNIYNPSDERLKENMVELTDGLDKIKKLKPYSFTWKKGFDENLDGVTHYGFGAHQAKTVDEILVEKFIESDIELDGETIKDTLRVNEKHVIPLLVKAIQELSAKVAALEGS